MTVMSAYLVLNLIITNHELSMIALDFNQLAMNTVQRRTTVGENFGELVNIGIWRGMLWHVEA